MGTSRPTTPACLYLIVTSSLHDVVPRAAGLVAVLLSVVLLQAGCTTSEIDSAHSEAAVDEDHDHDHDHVIPANKPKDLAGGVNRLRQFVGQFGGSSAAPPPDVIADLADQIRWLPELAADCDLPESDWNRVDLIAGHLRFVLQQALAQDRHANDLSTLYESITQALPTLEPIAESALAVPDRDPTIVPGEFSHARPAGRGHEMANSGDEVPQ